jgi:hypothetical protein
MKKILPLTLFLIISMSGCSKTEPIKLVEQPKQSEELIKRINDSREVCNSMKDELDKMKKKMDSNWVPQSVIDYEYKLKLPEVYLKSSTEYVKVCGVFNDK